MFLVSKVPLYTCTQPPTSSTTAPSRIGLKGLQGFLAHKKHTLQGPYGRTSSRVL